jgi:hypothetical protein
MQVLPSHTSRGTALVLLAGLYLFPQARTLWSDFRYKRSLLDRMKAALELTKLGLEIEALKKQHGFSEAVLARIEAPFLEVLGSQPAPPSATTASFFVRLRYALLGGLSFSLLVTLIAAFDDETDFATGADIAGWTFGFLVIVLLGGAVAAALPWGNRLRAYVNGFALPFLIALIIGLLAS